MKPHLRSLKKGQQVWALIDDVIANEELIINFGGDLVRVQNKTERVLSSGQRFLLQVESVSPLKLKLLFKPLSGHRSNTHLDLSI